MTVRLAVSHSPLHSSDDLDDLGPSSPTGCKAGFHGSGFDLRLQSAERIKAPFLFFNCYTKGASELVIWNMKMQEVRRSC
jgi:hypothetical protein